MFFMYLILLMNRVIVAPIETNSWYVLSDAGRDDCELGLGLLARHDSVVADGNRYHT
jgi:hypothetical protein